MMGNSCTRRRFLSSAAAASLVGVSACASARRYRGPVSGGPRIAVIGLRVQGRRHLQALLRRTDVDVTGVCDPDPRVLGHAMALGNQYKRPVPPFLDVRKLLDSSEVDAVVIATPDHWHCLLTDWALQAGKHVYVESPPSHSIQEGTWMLEAARRHQRVVRAAMPLRSHRGVRDGVAFLHQGGAGRILDVKAFCYLDRRSLGTSGAPCVLPKGLDFDLWAGPAPLEVPRRGSLHGDWRFDWRTGNGDTGEWGLHAIDLAHWIARADALPEQLWACGGRLGPADDGVTPNTILAGFRYPSTTMAYEACSLPSVRGKIPGVRRAGLGVLVTATKGRALFDAQRGSCIAQDHDGGLLGEFRGRGDSLGEFIRDLAENRGRLSALRSALRAASLVHLVHNAQRSSQACGRADVLRGLAEVRPLLDSFYSLDEQLGNGGLDFDQSGALCSGWRRLERHGAAFESFPGANDLSARTYRRGFTPDQSLRSE